MTVALDSYQFGVLVFLLTFIALQLLMLNWRSKRDDES